MLRWALYEAAVYAARPSSLDHAYYRQLRLRLEAHIALITVAASSRVPATTRCATPETTRSRSLLDDPVPLGDSAGVHTSMICDQLPAIL